MTAFAVFKAYRAAADAAAEALVVLQKHSKDADITEIQLARILELSQKQLIWLANRRSKKALLAPTNDKKSEILSEW